MCSRSGQRLLPLPRPTLCRDAFVLAPGVAQPDHQQRALIHAGGWRSGTLGAFTPRRPGVLTQQKPSGGSHPGGRPAVAVVMAEKVEQPVDGEQAKLGVEPGLRPDTPARCGADGDDDVAQEMLHSGRREEDVALAQRAGKASTSVT